MRGGKKIRVCDVFSMVGPYDLQAATRWNYYVGQEFDTGYELTLDDEMF